ncbi:hypothetical protein GMORB2_4998 [Geosmithia morbida]|uniref:Peroxin/Ferlin domain-containing protein n=1 Tax=Geosmithia morbida TaxID=1094350 RepID=A0A9P4YXI5_9HYPO|nr:uncharacterized protein GMORB2_4998 [Geosmithia morbida]KAF4124332.1 hypothetical protein GMORB2_4998 [Geosmithia morbida]
MHRIRSSRRAVGLKPADYDHTIDLVDHDADTAPDASLARTSTEARLLPSDNVASQSTSDAQSSQSATGRDTERDDDAQTQQPQQGSCMSLDGQHDLPHPAMKPSIEVRAPSSDGLHGDDVVPEHPKVERETAMDILYENERGSLLCGCPMFSSGLLSGFDPPHWTNAYHKPSPSDTTTAQVPDPTWEWVWPDWHINRQEGVDEGGWEYSFAFGNMFSWHGPKWYNSFVRRRAWTCKRAKKRTGDISTDPHMINGDYFSVQPTSALTKQLSRRSPAGSRPASHMTVSSHDEQASSEIEDLDTLLPTLRRAALDREKLEATIQYLDHARDLDQLQGEMHGIMRCFVFQASRRLLLGHIMRLYNSTKGELDDDDAKNEGSKKEGDDKKKEEGGEGGGEEGTPSAPELRDRCRALEAALKHAEEEVRKLAYWSDVKQMADRGIARPHEHENEDKDGGPCNAWEGLDHSGPSGPNGDKLPGTDAP